MLLGIALQGCGGGPVKLKPGVVAQVGNVSITEAELNHGISLAGTVAEKQSGSKVTKPLIFDPPNFATCAADLEAAGQAKSASTHEKSSASGTSLSAFESQCKTEYEQLKTNSLEHLIYVNWTIKEAGRLGLSTSPAEIQQRLNEIKQGFEKQPGGYQKFLQQSGETQADLLREATFTLLQGKLSQKMSAQVMAKANSQGIPQAQIDAYYKENLRNYEHPETRKVQLILTESLGAVLHAKREILSGKSFASVEKRVSVYPAEQVKKSGGLLPEAVVRRKFETIKHSTPGASTPSDEKILEEAIFQAKEHVLTGPVKTSEAYFLLQINEVKKEEPTEPLAQVESAIKSKLIYRHAEGMFSNFNKALEKRWKAKTSCAKGFVVLYCEQFVPHKEMSLLEQSKLHGKELEAIEKHEKVQKEHEIRLSSPAIIKPSILEMERNARPSFVSRYTCDGANISPPFNWSNLPKSTAEVLLLVKQATDRGVQSYIWLVGGISPSAHGISAGSLPAGAVVGRNNSGNASWGGICPRHGAQDEYLISLVAVNKKLGLKPGFKLKDLTKVLEKSRLGAGIMLAGYKRR